MQRHLLLLLFAVTVTGFVFPETEPEPGPEPEEYVYSDEDLVDPAAEAASSEDGGVEGRFFFGNSDWRKLGSAAKNLLTTLRQPGSQRGQEPPAPPDLAVYDVYEEEADESPDHGFPVDAEGNIYCSGLRRHMRRACRRARRQQMRQARRQDRGPWPTRRPPPAPTSGGPDRQALQQAAQSCCHLQQSGNLFSFNNCCQKFQFCPICEVDSKKLATEECCPLKFSGDELGYRQCCSTYGMCPTCDEAPAAKNQGCLYKGQSFAVNTEMDKLPYKCMFIRCKETDKGPQTELEYLDQVGCCEQGKDLFPPGSVLKVDECTNRVCRDGQWVDDATDLAAVFASRCPEGWLDLGGSCVYIWRELMTWTNASAACGKLLGTLALPQNQAQLSQLINAFNNMEDRDSSKELGGWVGARYSGRQWQTSEGDTLTYQPWEEGSPDDVRRTACVGLTVTSRSQGWRDYLCNSRQNMLYPICQVRKKGCGESNSGCGPIQGDMMFPPESQISTFSSQCESFRCNAEGYVVREVDQQCCYHHEWNGQAFGRARGWYAGLYPPGDFQPYPGLRCECTGGAGDCTQYFDEL